MTVEIRQGDARAVLETLPAASVHCVITSPPYYSLRNYDCAGQIGLEATPAAYIAALVEVFRAVHRVLRDDGTCWLVIGDSFSSGNSGLRNPDHSGGVGARTRPTFEQGAAQANPGRPALAGVAAKNLLMIPHRVALALQADGWYVRNDCVWAKGSAMPESVQDRFSRAHEYVFHLAKSERYYFDPIAAAEPVASVRAYPSWAERKADGAAMRRGDPGQSGDHNHGAGVGGNGAARNRRSVLHINPQPFSAADFGVKDVDHYAVFPEKLVEILTLCSTSEAGCCPRCAAPWRRVVERGASQRMGGHAGVSRGHADGPMARGGASQWDAGHMPLVRPTITTGWQAGCTCEAGPPIGCTVLDIFCGSGTTGVVAKRYGRNFIGIELNQSYCTLSEKRIASVCESLFTPATLSSTSTGAAR